MISNSRSIFKRNFYCCSIVLLSILALTACAARTVVHPTQSLVDSPKRTDAQNILIFFDGTANSAESRTNISKLYSLVTLSERDDIKAIYIPGVGTDGVLFKPIIGMATGAGIGEDVRSAYAYLSEHYDHTRGDKIFIFGFSRGAYAARILAGLMYTADVPTLGHLQRKQREDTVQDIYSAFKGDYSIAQRQKLIADAAPAVRFAPSIITFMGLWDTVEALGFPDYSENIEMVNSNYVDQICNVNKAAHALSIDDNRAQIFTPISLTTKSLITNCLQTDIDDVVEEVWFSGAHSDVGGGNQNTSLSGVSLNWMLEQIAEYSLLPRGTRVYEDIYGRSNDPSTGFFEVIYMNLNRNIPIYMKQTQYNQSVPKIHASVFQRLEKVPKGAREFDWVEKGEKHDITTNYPHCFKDPDAQLLELKANQQCFDIVK